MKPFSIILFLLTVPIHPFAQTISAVNVNPNELIGAFSDVNNDTLYNIHKIYKDTVLSCSTDTCIWVHTDSSYDTIQTIYTLSYTIIIQGTIHFTYCNTYNLQRPLYLRFSNSCLICTPPITTYIPDSIWGDTNPFPGTNKSIYFSLSIYIANTSGNIYNIADQGYSNMWDFCVYPSDSIAEKGCANRVSFHFYPSTIVKKPLRSICSDRQKIIAYTSITNLSRIKSNESVIIYNLNGKFIKHLNNANTRNESDLPSGLYILNTIQ